VEFLDSTSNSPEFFVGVEMAYANATFSDVKVLVDKVKDYTNLFVIGSPEISLNESLLNQTCDYIVGSGLHFVVLFTDTTMYDYVPYVWIIKAKQKYGDMFLAVYRFDELGGNQMDNGTSQFVPKAANYSDAAKSYVNLVNGHMEYYFYAGADVLTADYCLYWFDYKAGYDTILAEFGFNHSRGINMGLCRGAANAFNRDWGAIVTWRYSNVPVLESGSELYDDLTLAYRGGAKYAVVFDYPKSGPYGLLGEEHFDALRRFWDYSRANPQEHGSEKGEVAYVLPGDYGFGFRSADDKVWGLFNADELSAKVWGDVNNLLNQYGSRLDIVYDDSATFSVLQNRYQRLFFWNETIS
jgi:hypothetical protein